MEKGTGGGGGVSGKTWKEGGSTNELKKNPGFYKRGGKFLYHSDYIPR